MDVDRRNAMYRPDVVRAVNARRRAEAEARRREEEKVAAAVKAERIAALKARIDDQDRVPAIKDIAAYISELHDIPVEVMVANTGHTRQAPEIERARSEAIVLIRDKRPEISASRIGLFFNRDHSSVLSILWKYAKVKKYQSSGPRPEGFVKCG